MPSNNLGGSWSKYYKTAGIVLFFSLFLLLRLYRLDVHDFWFDEVGSVDYARYPWGNWNAPLYWIGLHFWIKIFGISEFSLRFPSVVFSFLSVILVFLLGKELFDKKTGLLAALFMGLSPFHLWYAQEARDYSMALFLGTLSSLLLLQALRKNTVRLWLFFTIVSALGLYTNYFYIFLFLIQGVYLFLLRRPRLEFKGAIFFLAVCFLFLLYLPRFLSKFYYIWQGFWLPIPDKKAVVITLENFVFGYNGFPELYLLGDIFCLLFFFSACRKVYKQREFRLGFSFCSMAAFLPLILAFIFSKIFFSVYLDRGLIIFSPYFYLILAAGAAFLFKPVQGILVGVLFLALVTVDYRFFSDLMVRPFEHRVGTYIKPPYKKAVRFLEDRASKDDIIAFVSSSAMPSFGFYSRNAKNKFYYFFDSRFSDTDWGRPMSESEFCLPFYKINDLRFKRLWVIFSQGACDFGFDKNSQSVKKWLDEHFATDGVKQFDGLLLVSYARLPVEQKINQMQGEKDATF